MESFVLKLLTKMSNESGKKKKKRDAVLFKPQVLWVRRGSCYGSAPVASPQYLVTIPFILQW